MGNLTTKLSGVWRCVPKTGLHRLNCLKQKPKSWLKFAKQIDEAYLSINRGIAELGYAANHIQVCQPISESEMERFRTSPNIKYSTETVSKLIDCHQNVYSLIPIINEETQRAKLRLDAIPASSWVKSLKPQIGPENLFLAPDGRLFNPDTSKFYSDLDVLNENLEN